MFSWIIIIGIITVLIGSVTTLSLAKNQNPKQNVEYWKKSPRTLLLILLIYVVTLIIAGFWLYFFYFTD